MTAKSFANKKKEKYFPLSNIICISVTLVALLLSNDMKSGIYEGLIFSFSTIIPTLFPFFIISDLWSEFFEVKQDSKLQRIFSLLFGINGQAVGALLSGIVCGFPIGAKASADLYKKKSITLQELELLSCISNTPSSAFVISGIGVGIFGDIRIGIILYFSVIISSILLGVLFRTQRNKSHFMCNISEQNFNFALSITNAGLSSVNVASFIIIFSAILKVLKGLINHPLIFALFASLLEIGNAAKEIANLTDTSLFSKLLLISFSLGFSGLSVYFQTLIFLPKEVNLCKYLFRKFIQGIICSIVFSFLFLLII